MRVGHLLKSLLFSLIFCAVKLVAQPVVRLEADTLFMLPGDANSLTINYLDAEKSKPDPFNSSLLDSILMPENILQKTVWQPQTGGGWQLILHFTAFDSGEIRIPVLPVFVEKNGQKIALKTGPLTIQVGKMPLPGGTELAPIKPIRTEPGNWRDHLPLLLSILGVVAAILLIWGLIERPFRKKKLPILPPPPPVSAWEAAKTSLFLLEKKGLWQAGEVKNYHSQLTEIIRIYLSKRFEIRALEGTTDDILAALRQTNFPENQHDLLREILQKIDLVKFAKAEPTADFHALAMSRAHELIEATMPVSESQVIENQEVEPPAISFSEKSTPIFLEKNRPETAPDFSKKYASISRRLAAGLIDLTVWIAGLVGSIRLAGLFFDWLKIRDDGGAGTGAIGLTLLFSLVSFTWFFHIFLERRGWTPGKIAFGLRVLDFSEKPMTGSQARTRFLAKFTPENWGLRGADLDPNRQARHDHAADTVVIFRLTIDD